LRLEGKFTVDAPPEHCLSRLRDPLWLGKCLPNLSSLELIGDKEFRAVFYLNLAEMAKVAGYLSRIRTDMRFTYMETSPGEVRVAGDGRAVGAKISIDISVRVSSKDDGSVLEWVSIVDLGIIQRLLGEETVRRVADKQIGLLTNCLSEALRKGV